MYDLERHLGRLSRGPFTRVDKAKERVRAWTRDLAAVNARIAERREAFERRSQALPPDVAEFARGDHEADMRKLQAKRKALLVALHAKVTDPRIRLSRSETAELRAALGTARAIRLRSKVAELEEYIESMRAEYGFASGRGAANYSRGSSSRNPHACTRPCRRSMTPRTLQLLKAELHPARPIATRSAKSPRPSRFHPAKFGASLIPRSKRIVRATFLVASAFLS